MLLTLSRCSTIVLTVLALSWMLPAGFDKAFDAGENDPLLFFSPLRHEFIYQESLGHHQFRYRNEDGLDYSRQEFEAQLPFIYFRTLALQNQLPLIIDGQAFDAETIQDSRQVVDIRSRHLTGHYPQIPLYPLFNNDPQVAIMPFPEDVFRLTATAMEFINADTNRIDSHLTELFTTALQAREFKFPATAIGGKPTNLKPFDAGYFIRDQAGQLFQVRRVLNQPEITRIPVDPALEIRDLMISENQRREFHGLAITASGDVYLLPWSLQGLAPLPAAGYDPTRMDFKLLIDPLYRTVTRSDDQHVYGIAMDADYQVLRTFAVAKSNVTPAFLRQIRDVLFPFQLTLSHPSRNQAQIAVTIGGSGSLAGIAIVLAGYSFFGYIRKRKIGSKTDMVVIALTGIYGLAAVICFREV